MSQADTPRLMKTAPKVADSAAKRMSQARARAKPPPTAAPFTAAMTGWRSRWIFSNRPAMCSWLAKVRTTSFWADSRMAPIGVPPRPCISSGPPFMSAPAEKPAPAPVRITTRMAGSDPMRVHRLVQLGQHLVAEGVAAVLTVDGQDDDAVLELPRCSRAPCPASSHRNCADLSR